MKHRVTTREPIDIWTGWMRLSEALQREHDVDHSEIGGPRFLDRWYAAQTLAYPIIKGQRLRHEPMVTGLPGDEDGHALLLFAFKLDNNGTVVLVEEMGSIYGNENTNSLRG